MTTPLTIRPTCHRVSRSPNANTAPITPPTDIALFFVATVGGNSQGHRAPAAGATSYRLITASGEDLGGDTIHRNAMETTTAREGLISLLYALRAFRRAHPDFAGQTIVMANNRDLVKDISKARRVWQFNGWKTGAGASVRQQNLLASLVTLLPEDAPEQYHLPNAQSHVPGSREATEWANEEFRRVSLIAAAVAAA